MQKTALYSSHLALQAKMVPFAGFSMPLQYKGILEEHRAVRESAGIFDVSHMGIIRLSGKEMHPFLEKISTNYLQTQVGVATYTLFCNASGGTVDDLIIYQVEEQTALLVVNASNREKDLAFLQQERKNFQVEIEPLFTGWGILSVQGPKVPAIVAGMAHMRVQPFEGGYIATTGYTGERGFELIMPESSLPALWNQFVSQGVQPAGLGARDVLRLEMGYALYGHELSETIHPLESVAAWAYKRGDHPLLQRRAHGIILEGARVPRENFPVYFQGEQVGVVTSGGYSPSLKRPIALILVDQKVKRGDSVEIEIRGVREKATVVSLPLFRREK